jgi:hypothetical protein
MDGLRQLATSVPVPLHFTQNEDIPDSFAAVHIASTPATCELTRLELCQSDLAAFFRSNDDDDGTYPPGEAARHHRLKLVCVPIDRVYSISVNEDVYTQLVNDIGVDLWVERLIRVRAHGFYQSGTTSYFGTSFTLALWTTHHEPWGLSTKCLLFFQTRDMLGGAPTAFRQLHRLLATFDMFKKDSYSPLYLPFMLSVDAFSLRERTLTELLAEVHIVGSQTGHGSWGRHFGAERDSITELTATLGAATNSVGNTL